MDKSIEIFYKVIERWQKQIDFQKKNKEHYTMYKNHIDGLQEEVDAIKSCTRAVKTLDVEVLAKEEHDIWASWMLYLFSKGTCNKDGTWAMPKWAVERWRGQSIAKYHNLSEEEKGEDRKVVRRWHKSLSSAFSLPRLDEEKVLELLYKTEYQLEMQNQLKNYAKAIVANQDKLIKQ